MSNRTNAIASFLSRLEQAEARLLAWGLVDGSFVEDELLERAESFLTQQGLWDDFDTSDELIAQLEDDRLLFTFLDGIHVRYRTRMGETIRLLSRLRQLFPRHMVGRQWQTAPSLVADYRFILRPREFPRRTLSRDTIVQQIREVTTLDQLQLDMLDALLCQGSPSPLQLADFQLRATRSVLCEVSTSRATGTVVCAGTGSGKTLAFYLPAFLYLGPILDRSRWTRCLAIYPRNELLKDQLSETYRQARRGAATLRTHGRRTLALGTLFGSTPESGVFFSRENPPRGWTPVANGFVCPYLRCPEPNCGGQMVWLDSDRSANIERLRCSSCGASTAPDELVLTRQRLRSEPPDILFTTTEMLNQRIGDSQLGPLFGVGADPRQKPQLVLLDEIHTYSGVSGAQVALLLRRWQRAARVQPHFVGLSATLTDARRFFARLVGIDEFRVDEVGPHPSELDRRGMEYMLAVRSDPASGASVLSTTIQTAMLMRRIQDAGRNGPGEGLYGTRAFVFTDDLDVTNRLFFNLRDAEGQDSWGRRDPQKPDGSLANLRSATRPDGDLRFRFGQSWKLCEDIGHVLQNNATLKIDRTSSQDTGVGTGADIIVATASLEVGFNDPDVDVVLQHKAPRDAAQFLQRKGRAGRRTDMRPWAVVVLSDYGRDRLAWQSYDLLFDPELPARELPVSNRYVLRMQAVYAFCDWIAEQLRRNHDIPNGSVWQDFSGPSVQLGSSYRTNARRRQLAAAHIVDNLLVCDDRHEEVSRYLQEALQQSSDVIAALMWEPPRALMNAVLPTLHRRLVSDWQRASTINDPDRQRYDYYIPNNPLPEFVPGRLFADLNLPEVTIVTPPQQRGDAPREEPMPILQAMRAFAPGRVSRRFGIRNEWARHWIALPSLTASPDQYLALSSYLSRYDELGDVQVLGHEGVRSVRCVRPFELQPQVPPRQVLDSSNAFLRWNTQIVPETEGLPVDLPMPSRWDGIIDGVRFFTHNHHTPLEVRRFAMASDAAIALLNGQGFETTVHFVETAPDEHAVSPGDLRPVAVGFSISVDGACVRLRIPDNLRAGSSAENRAKVRSLRTSLFRDRVMGEAALNGVANSFRRQWLAEIYLSALVYTSLANHTPLQNAWESLLANHSTNNFTDVLQIIFQSIPISADDHNRGAEHETDSELEETHQRLFHELSDLFHNQAVIDAIHRHAPALWELPDAAWDEWLRAKFTTTLGAAVLDAVQQLCPDLDAGDLALDIEPGPRPESAVPMPDGLEEIWLTERTVGGGGIIETFVARYGEDPRRFFDLVEGALRPSDFEMVDEQLTLVLNLIVDPHDSGVRDQIALLREAYGQSHNAYADAFNDLIRLLAQRGVFVCHSVVAALAARILKPGSSARTDQMLHAIVSDWHQREEQLGIDIDSRVFAYLHSRDAVLDEALETLSGDAIEVDRRQWRFRALLGLLWPRGNAVRGQRLTVYNPFAKLPDTEHDLVRDCLQGTPDIVNVTAENWRAAVTASLLRDSTVVLRATSSDVPRLRAALISIMTEPVDTGFLLLHPRVGTVSRGDGVIDITLELAEGSQ
jgi:hypothetical protein